MIDQKTKHSQLKTNWIFLWTSSFITHQKLLVLPPELPSSSWGCDDAPLLLFPQRTPKTSASARDACCNASPCWHRNTNAAQTLLLRVYKLIVFSQILLLKKGKVDEKLWDVDDAFKAEVILTSEQRIGTFGLEGNFKDFIPEWQRVRRLQTFTKQNKRKTCKEAKINLLT